jgi:hypothetical protein
MVALQANLGGTNRGGEGTNGNEWVCTAKKGRAQLRGGTNG